MTRTLMAAGAALALLASPALAQDGIFAAVGNACSKSSEPDGLVCVQISQTVPIQAYLDFRQLTFEDFARANQLPLDGSVSPASIIPANTTIATFPHTYVSS